MHKAYSIFNLDRVEVHIVTKKCWASTLRLCSLLQEPKLLLEPRASLGAHCFCGDGDYLARAARREFMRFWAVLEASKRQSQT